jgi:hypothetical protein
MNRNNAICTSRSATARNMVDVMAVLTMISLPMIALAGEGLTSWKLDIGVSSVYDNNILRYSDKYVTRFDNREDEGRFHIKTRDDLILVSSIRASATLNLFGSLNTIATADARQRTYTHNAIKNWSSIGFTLRQDLSKQVAAQIGYSYIPGFYVRHYRDNEWVKEYGYTPVTFQPFDFKKDELGGWVQYALFSGTRVRGRLAYMRYFYNEHFTEYDCRNTLLGIDVYQTVHRNIKVNGSFEFVRSREGGNIEKDPSSDENTFVLGVDFQLPKVFGRSNGLGVAGEHTRRYYRSKIFLEIDQEHAGRQDFEYLLSATYSFQLLDDLELALNYAWRRRNTETLAPQNATYLAEEKDYRQYQIGLEAKYTLNFVPSENSELERSK